MPFLLVQAKVSLGLSDIAAPNWLISRSNCQSLKSTQRYDALKAVIAWHPSFYCSILKCTATTVVTMSRKDVKKTQCPSNQLTPSLRCSSNHESIMISPLAHEITDFRLYGRKQHHARVIKCKLTIIRARFRGCSSGKVHNLFKIS
jgi:hypothetical protein